MQQTNNPINKEMFGSQYNPAESMKGGKIVNSLRDSSIIDTLG